MKYELENRISILMKIYVECVQTTQQRSVTESKLLLIRFK